jgi:Transposase domain (DUF772)
VESTDRVEPGRAKNGCAHTEDAEILCIFCARAALNSSTPSFRRRWPPARARNRGANRPWKQACWRCHVGDRDAVELTMMDKRWQLFLDCLGAEQPPFSQSTLYNFRLRLIAHNLDKTPLERTVALAERTGSFGARQLRAALDSTPLLGAGRVGDTVDLLGHALRKAVRVAAAALGTSTAVLIEAADLALVGQSSLKAALDLDWGDPMARARALGLVLEEVERLKHWLEQQSSLSIHEPPMQEVIATLDQMIAQDTEPDPDGSPGGLSGVGF